ncbi:MAG: translation elongation factor Ts [Mariprofundaceae bacterium]
MTQVTASQVKQLREKTGAGMMDCKKALSETAGDMEAAVDFLRKKGLSASEKKAGRVAAEGLVASISEGNVGVLIEVNSETDFVSKNDMFQDFVARLAALVLVKAPADVEALLKFDFGDGKTVSEALNYMVANIGENINIRRIERAEVADGTVGTYVHAGGKIATMVGISGAADHAAQTLARDFAIHVAAANPRYINRDQVAVDAVEREREVLSERARATGKPDNIIEKIVDGQMNKFYAEVCLLEQGFVKDTDQTIDKVLKATAADANVVAMHRFQLGEGIEKAASDFAAEVAAQANV